MRVLITCQYFPPEITAGANRVHAFAAGLVRRGHEVTVISEVPNHPAGVLAPGFGGRLLYRRRMDGAAVKYVWVYVTPSKRARARLLNYASFAGSATVAGWASRRADVVLASSPPLPVGAVGAALAVRHRCPWVLDVRDLWPDAAVVLEQLSEGPVLRTAQRVERRLYRSADAITVTTEPTRREVERRGGEGKVEVIPNGTTEEFLGAGARPPEKGLFEGPDDVFRWTYPGNLGLVAGLDTAIEAARELGEGFQLVLLGEGTLRQELQRKAASLPSGTVVFHEPVPPVEAARLMRASDALLASRAPAPQMDGMILSKLYDCCAVARPVIVAAAGETSRVAEEAGAALTVPPADPGKLAEAVRRLKGDETLRESLATGARAFAESNSRERGVGELERILVQVTRGTR